MTNNAVLDFIFLNPMAPVKTGKRAEVKKARNAYGIIFYHRNPPRESVLLKILKYSHWVYMNTAFYDDDYQAREILEDFFEEYSFPVKPETNTRK